MALSEMLLSTEFLIATGALAGLLIGLFSRTHLVGSTTLVLVPIGAIIFTVVMLQVVPGNSTAALAIIFLPPIPTMAAFPAFYVGKILRYMWLNRKSMYR